MRHLKKIALVTFILLSFQNCARVPFLQSNFKSIGMSDGSSMGLSVSDPIQTPFALLSGEQLLKGMLNVTGTTTTTAVTTEFTSRANVFSLGPDLKLTSSPMMIGITSLGGEVCNTLLTTETAKAAADRAFFGGIDFTSAASQILDSQYDSVIRAMARNFWGRNETDEERQIFYDSKTEFLTNLDAAKKTTPASTRDLMLFTCAAMISTVDAITY